MADVDKEVTADPWNVSSNGPCEACGATDRRRPTVPVALTQEQLRKRAQVDTSPLETPFSGREPGPLLLCINCRSSKVGWPVISDSKWFGRKKCESVLKAWKRRATPVVSRHDTCYVCNHLLVGGKASLAPDEGDVKKNPVLNLQLLRVLLHSKEIQELFCSDLSARSGMSVKDARFLLQNIPYAKFCSLHHNQSRHSSDLASLKDPSTKGVKFGFCVFRGRGCSGSNVILRPLPRLNLETLEDTETYFEYDESVLTHSSGSLQFDDVSAKQASGVCRYVITKGAHGIRPNPDTAILNDAADRCLVDAILYSLDAEGKDSLDMKSNTNAFSVARKLKCMVVAPFPEIPNSRFLPISCVYSTRKALVQCNGHLSTDVCNKTVDSRLGPGVAARNVHLHSLSRKFRCYAFGSALFDTVQSVVSLSKSEEVSLVPRERRKQLLAVSKRFKEKKKNYRRGRWSLSDEIGAIPAALWSSYVMDMASTRQIASWKVYAVAEGKSILGIFPVLNDPSVLPVTELDKFDRRSVARRDREPGLRRADFLLCLRALKVIEQIVYSHSRTSVGPLQMTLSIAGIVEQSPSWTSVLHALGVVTSYDSTETYRKRLIAEREQAADGAFSEMQLENRVVTLQIDNFDMLPLHSVKASGKRIPMISGTATQVVVHSRKRRRLAENTPVQNCHSMAAHSAGADMSWRDPKDVLPSRDRFIKRLHSPTDQSMLDDFFDIVFGVVHEHRDSVLGIGDSAGTYKRGPNVKSYKHKGINFRTLMLSCFKQHGGLDSSHPALAEQEVLFVDISRMSAADILTIHQKLALIKQLLRPGEPGRPVYVVVSGDQPTYKMIVKIWRNSYCESKRGNSKEPLCGELQVHEWLIPFPGFFHVEKQSLYPLCKERLHGVGLQELAAYSGLSESQIDNILRHSHARNNRAVLFNICAALVVHTSDLIKTESPEVRDSIKRIEDGADSDQGAATGRSSIHGGDSKLLSCLSSRVTDRTIEMGRLLRKRVLDFFAHSPNGKHIVCTVLFTCLLPTLGFHILSRTGHTDVLDGFWLLLNNVLHASGHLKYQELYLFYAFFRCIIPPAVVQDIFLNKPGAMVARVPAFTSGIGSPYDARGSNYVHLDEILEMLIVRLVKGLNLLMLQYLETSAAWLLAVSSARMMIRSVTAASHSYQRSRQADEGSPRLHSDNHV